MLQTRHLPKLLTSSWIRSKIVKSDQNIVSWLTNLKGTGFSVLVSTQGEAFTGMRGDLDTVGRRANVLNDTVEISKYLNRLK